MTKKIRAHELIGYILLLHWVVLLFDRAVNNQLHNMVWVSHLALLLAAIGFLMASRLILTGTLIAVLIAHGFWIYDMIFLILTGIAPLDYVTYTIELSTFRRLLTIHHIYLIPLLFLWLFGKKGFHKRGWIVASGLIIFATVFSFVFLPFEYNINCAHQVCKLGLAILPFMSFINDFSPIIQLIVSNIVMIMGFILINMLLIGVSKLAKTKTRKP